MSSGIISAHCPIPLGDAAWLPGIPPLSLNYLLDCYEDAQLQFVGSLELQDHDGQAVQGWKLESHVALSLSQSKFKITKARISCVCV